MLNVVLPLLTDQSIFAVEVWIPQALESSMCAAVRDGALAKA
jgi:hypothetical protein